MAILAKLECSYIRTLGGNGLTLITVANKRGNGDEFGSRLAVAVVIWHHTGHWPVMVIGVHTYEESNHACIQYPTSHPVSEADSIVQPTIKRYELNVMGAV